MVAKQPSRPRDKIAELDTKMGYVCPIEFLEPVPSLYLPACNASTCARALERERTITSIDLKQEREILKQIHRLEKVKREVQAFEAHDKLIKNKKVGSTEWLHSGGRHSCLTDC